ncbi:MAG: hypothetical protein ABIZ81_17625, partial [Opitutaceae bacterium]
MRQPSREPTSGFGNEGDQRKRLARLKSAKADDTSRHPGQALGHSQKLLYLDVDSGPGSARVWRAG